MSVEWQALFHSPQARRRRAPITVINTLEAKLPVDLRAVGQEPTDEQLAEIMDDVARVAREKRVAAELKSRSVLAADLLAAQDRLPMRCLKRAGRSAEDTRS